MPDDKNTRDEGMPTKSIEQPTRSKSRPSGISSTKAGGYASQKRYKQNHPDRVIEQRRKRSERLFEPKLRIPRKNKHIVDRLISETGMNLSDLFIRAVEDKYGVTLLDTPDSVDNTGDM